MTLLTILILALVQGLTEFLPVSSSAHLILVGHLLGVDQGLAFDVAAHVGTLIAVCLYFRRDLAAMAVAVLAPGEKSATDRREQRLFFQVALATVPGAVAGLLFVDLIATTLRQPVVYATTSIVFGLLLGLADRFHGADRDEHRLGWGGALFIGFAQAVALIPGTSRSGITMTAGLFLGLTRTAAARFSFLMAIPIMVLAGGYEALHLLLAETAVHWANLGLAALFSFIAALACIHAFLKLIERIGMWPFVIYRIVLGIALFWAFTGWL